MGTILTRRVARVSTSGHSAQPRSATLKSLLLSACLTFALGQSAFAQWEVDIEADLGVAYTDNLRLVTDDDLAEEETVFVVSPSFLFAHDSERLDADIRYSPEAFYYDEADENDQVFHAVDTNITTTLVRDALFLNLTGSRFQTNGAQVLNFPTSNLPVAGNRVDSTNYSIRPTWAQNLGFAEILAEVAYQETKFSEAEDQANVFLQDNDQRSARFSLSNRTRGEGFVWGLGYDYRRVEFEQAVPFENQSAFGEIGYWINAGTRIFALGGRETPFDSFFEPSLEADFWEAGFQYTPNQRLDLELAAGRRSFGDTGRARFSYQLRRGLTELSYTQNVVTQGELFAGRRPLNRTDNLGDILDRPGRADRFLQKLLNWQTTIQLAKSEFSLRLFSEERERRTTDGGNPLPNEAAFGGAVRWSWRFGPASTLGLAADLANREFDGADTELRRYSIDYALQLSQRLALVFLVQRTEESGEAGFARNYEENQARMNFRVTLL